MSVRFDSRFWIASVMVLLPLRGWCAMTFNQVGATDWQIGNGIVTVDYNPTTGELYNLDVMLHGVTYNEVNSSVSIPNIGHGSPTPRIYNLDAQQGGAIQSGYSIGDTYVDVWASVAPLSGGNSATVVNHYVILDGVPGVMMYAVINHEVADGGAGSLIRAPFVVQTADTNLRNFYMADTSFRSRGMFRYNLPDMPTQAAAAAVSSRNVQKETIDYTGFVPDSQLVETYTTASGLTGTTPSRYITKYDFSTTEEFHVAHGLYGTEPNNTTLGVWAVYPSHESETGGPNSQDTTGESSGPMLTIGYGNDHFGGQQYVVPSGSATHLFGPVFLYFNDISTGDGSSGSGGDADADSLYLDAAAHSNLFKHLAETDAALLANGYIPCDQRGSVAATIDNPTGWSEIRTDNLVVLSDDSTNFQHSNQGTQYWGYVDPQTNTVALSNVVPGTYRLSAYVRGQFGELRADNVLVQPNSTTAMAGLTFVPEHFGTSVFSIGTPDRSGNEFLFGHIGDAEPAPDQRNYQGQYDYYGALATSPIPGAVVYFATSVGSTPATQGLAGFPMNLWNRFNPAEYAGVYNASDTTQDGYKYVVARTAPYVGDPSTYTPPPWQLHFALTPDQQAKRYAVLSIGIAAEESDLTVALNGHPLVWKGFQRMPTVNDPMQRSGVSGYYQWVAFQWDMADLNPPGTDNVITLAVNRLNGVMWDAFRMEVSDTGADPAVTGWSDYEFLYGTQDTLVNDSASSNDGTPVQTFTSREARSAARAR